MEKGTVKRRILISNVTMVLATLVLFLLINMFVIFCYSESIEDEVKTTIESVVSPDDIDELLKHYTIYRNEFILLFGVDGVLCIIGLIVVSQVFTKNLTEHIMEPLDALAAGTERIKSNNLEENIVYTGDKEFENVCNSFNEMMQSISTEQEKNRKYEKARTDMIAGISHDLRTPLTAIKGTIKGLIDGVASKPEQQRKFLETAYRRTGDMDRLLNQLFYLSRIETGNVPLDMKNIDIAEFLDCYVKNKLEYTHSEYVKVREVQNVEKDRKNDIKDNNKDVIFDIENDKQDGGIDKKVNNKDEITGIEKNEIINIRTNGITDEICVDSEQLIRILDNLIENSRKYAQSNPLVIDINLMKNENVCTICVKDNGVGVSDEQLPYIFEEFYRADESRNKKEGNGLGLYIVKYLCESMNGNVRAENTNGLAVYLEFPMSDYAEKNAENYDTIVK